MTRSVQIFCIIFIVALFIVSPDLHAQPIDSLNVVQVDPLNCCYQVFLHNSHDPPGNLNGFALEITDQGIEFVPGVNGGPWPPMLESEQRFKWEVPDEGLPPGEWLDPFDICIDYPAGNPAPFYLVYETFDQGRLVSRDSVLIDCRPIPPSCDSLRMFPGTIAPQPDETSCFELRLLNAHTPAGDLNDLHISILTPGATFAGIATGPWDVRSQSTTDLVYATTSVALPSGDSLDGFTFCVRPPNGLPGNVTFSWWSSRDGAQVCSGELTVQCTPLDLPACDSLFASKQGECVYDFGFKNLHKPPRGQVSGYRMSVLTPGARLTDLVSPPGWQISSQTALNARMSALSPVNYGTLVRGFRASFKPGNTGVIRVAVSTTFDDQIICRDTLTMFCQPPPPEYCDSLLTARMEGDCIWNIGVVNSHEPASDIDDFHITLQTPGASIDSITAPAGWTITGSTATTASFKSTSGPLPQDSVLTGFLLGLVPGPAGNDVVFEWCTSLSDTTLCCELASVSCEPQVELCDTLIMSEGGEYCSYDLGFANLHTPASGVNDFHVQLLTTGAYLLDAEAPQGWTVDSRSGNAVHFSMNSGSVPPGAEATGFLLRLVPSAVSREIRFAWTTTEDGTYLCSDTTSVFCDVVTVRCDSVDVTTSIERPCCFDFSLSNTHLPFTPLNDFHVIVLTPDVIVYPSTVETPAGWTASTSDMSVSWQHDQGALQPGDQLGGFAVCFDNDATGNQDFRVLWQSTLDGIIVCQDTLLVKCDRTLSVERLGDARPADFTLEQNYPNPFNPVTTIVFTVPREADVDLALYDMHGRLLRDLGSGSYAPGRYRVSLDASALPSGSYIYRLRAAGRDISRRMLLVK